MSISVAANMTDLAIIATQPLTRYLAEHLDTELSLNSTIVEDLRSATLLNAQLILELTISEGSASGFFVQSPAYTELVRMLEEAILSVGIPKEREFQLLDSTLPIIRLNLGYTGNSYLTESTMFALKEAVSSKLLEPATYNQVVSDRVLTSDPYFKTEAYRKANDEQGVISYATVSFSDIPAKILDFKRISPSPYPSFIESTYATTSGSESHTLIFSAKAIDSNTTMRVIVGDSTKDLEVTTGNYGIFTVDFKPQRIELYKSELLFHLHTREHDLAKSKAHIGFDLIAVPHKFKLDEYLPFNIEVRSSYKYFFGLPSTGHIEIAGIWISKRGVLDTLDDPLASYTPYPTTYNATTAVANPTPFAVANPYSPETTGGSLLGKASNILNMMTNPASLPKLLGLSQIENVMNTYLKSLSSTISSISALAGGKIPYVNPASIKIDFAALEASLDDSSIDFLKKKNTQAMLTEMRKLQRATNLAKTSEVNVTKKIADMEKQLDLEIKKGLTTIGKDLKEVTQKVGAIEKSMASLGSMNGTINSSFNLATKVPKTLNIPGLPNINLGSQLSQVTGGLTRELSKINTLGADLTKIQSQINSAIGKTGAFNVPIPSTIGRNTGNNQTTNTLPDAVSTTVPANATEAPKTAMTTMQAAKTKTLISGIDYSKYLP